MFFRSEPTWMIWITSFVCAAVTHMTASIVSVCHWSTAMSLWLECLSLSSPHLSLLKKMHRLTEFLSSYMGRRQSACVDTCVVCRALLWTNCMIFRQLQHHITKDNINIHQSQQSWFILKSKLNSSTELHWRETLRGWNKDERKKEKVQYFSKKTSGFALGEMVQFDVPVRGCTKNSGGCGDPMLSSFISNVKTKTVLPWQRPMRQHGLLPWHPLKIIQKLEIHNPTSSLTAVKNCTAVLHSREPPTPLTTLI